LNISLLVSITENNVIGKENKLLFHLPKDLRHFKNTTWGTVIIMGRKTFDSIGKPLPGRTNIVITSNSTWQATGIVIASGLEDALQKAAATNCKEIFIVGGGEIYRQSMDLADTIYLTRVHAELEGDTFFPVIEETNWQLVDNEDFAVDEKHAYSFSIQVWKRKTAAS